MEQLASPFVKKLLDYTIYAIGRQLGYLIYYQKNIKVLKNQVEDLNDQQAIVQHSINEATRNGEKIEDIVKRWMSRVEQMKRQVEQFYEKESQARTRCSRTLCPNLWSRYQLSKKAKKLGLEVVKIQEKKNFDRVAFRDSPKWMLDSTNDNNNEGINSRVPIMNQLVEALGNPNVNMIGLCGLGGVGKTTIAKEVAKKVKDANMFEKVIIAIVSDDLNLARIQGQIAEMLGMKLEEEAKYLRIHRLNKRLKQEKNLLIILDDLWEKLDLDELGIPYNSDGKHNKRDGGCKILLTSRNERLLSDQMKCERNIKVGVLSKMEAWELFKRISEFSIDSNSPDLIDVANEIVQKCEGLPLAIVAIAGALRYKGSNEWKDALRRLKSPLQRNITGIKSVDSILKLSYDHLSPEEQPIFLLSAMLSHDPLVKDLLVYSVGLNLLKGVQNMEEAQCAFFTFVSRLKASSLLLDSFSNDYFTMHDVVREVALSIASDKNFFVMRHRKLDEWPDENLAESCTGICLLESEINDLPEELHGPTLEFFLLHSIDRGLNIPSMFFKSTKQLKVLVFTDMNFSSLPSLNYLEKLRSLCLHSCLLEDITEVGKLKKLKILSLAYSDIEQLPFELAQLTSLQMLNLDRCSKLTVIPPKLLSSLKRLEVLHMENSFNKWKAEGSCKGNENASLGELKKLPISSLDIHIPDGSILPEDLFLDNVLERYRIFIGEHWDWFGTYETSRTLKLELNRSIHLEHRVQKLLEKVEDLHLHGSNGHTNFLYNLDGRGCPHLKHLQIMNNDDIEYIVFNSTHLEVVCFPILKTLELYNLKGLKKLCQGLDIEERAANNECNDNFKSLFNNKVSFPKLEGLQLFSINNLITSIWDDKGFPHSSFSNLKTLTVERCGCVKLVPFHVLKSLNNLEELEVKYCDMLEMVFDFKELNSSEEIQSSSVVVPLKKLSLESLPKLKHVWSNEPRGIVSFQSLGQLEIHENKALSSSSALQQAERKPESKYHLFSHEQVSFPKLETLKLFDLNKLITSIWDDKSLPHSSFSNLKTVTVESCDFVTLVPLHVLKSLNNLEELEVEECDMLEMVFDFEELNSSEEIQLSSSVIIPLKKLILWRLPKLKHVWSNDPQGIVSFQSLRHVEVSFCESLTSIFPASLAKGCMLHLEKLKIRSCGIEVIVAKDEISDSIVPTFVFDSLINLKLRDLPNLKNFYPHNHMSKWPREELEIFENKASSSSAIQEERTPDLKYPLFFHDQVSFPKLEGLKLFSINNLIPSIWDDCHPHSSFSNLKTMTVFGCAFVKLVPLHVLKSLNYLEELRVRECDMLEMVFDFEELNSSEEIQSSSVVVSLKKLILYSLPKLKHVWSNDPHGIVSFQSLRHVHVDRCNSLTSMFPASIAKGCMLHLEKLRIWNCGIEVIVAKDEVSDSVAPTFVFDSLINLKLRNLPNLKNFYPHSHTFEVEVSFPKLEELKLIHINKLIPLIWDDRHPDSSISNLKTLTVERCGFVKLVPFHVLKSLNNLEELQVEECEMLEMVFDFEELNSSEEIQSSSVVVPLKKLKLFLLPKLKHVWSNELQGIVSFQSLRHVHVDSCNSLTSMFPASIAKGCMLHLEQLDISNCGIEVIVAKDEDSDSVAPTFVLDSLISLGLQLLPNLKNFYPHSYTSKWPRLKHIMITHCGELEIFENEASSSSATPEEGTPDLKYPLFSHDQVFLDLKEMTLGGKQSNKSKFSLGLLKRFPSLEKFGVVWGDIEEIFISSMEPLGEAPTFLVPELYLSYLKKVKHIWNEYSPPHILQCLENLVVSFCEDLISLGPSFISLANLTHLVVSGCEGLTNLLTSSTATSLVHLSRLEICDCKQIEEIIAKPQGEDDGEKEITFSKLGHLKLYNLPRLKSFCSHNYLFKFPLLDQVTVEECHRFKMFCPGDIHAPLLKGVQVARNQNFWDTNLNNTIQQRFTTKEVISTFKALVLDMKDVTMIMNDQFLLDDFTRVRTLYVESFVDDCVTFPYSILQRFPSLRKFHVEHSFFEEIFPSQAQTNDHMAKHAPFEELHLAHLDHLKNIWNDDSQLQPIHQNLNVLEVESCCSLIKLAPSSASLENLTVLVVSSCHQLLYLVTNSIAKSLVRLETWRIKDCQMMEEIVISEANEDVEDGISFSNLEFLELADLPSLKRFCSQSHTFKFPKLEEITITGCLQMKMFCPGVLETPTLTEVKIEEHYMDWKGRGDLNKAIELLLSPKDGVNI